MRAISVDQLERTKFNVMTFTGKFAESIGVEVERSGSWIIYGDSGHGKTELALQLAKYLTSYCKVAYNTIEEGARLTFRKAVERQKFTKEERKNFIILNEEIKDLRERLAKPKAPQVVIIDSVQFADITKREYKQLVREHANVLFIWISHVEGKKPLGALAVHVEYNSDVKIRVEGFKAFIKSRFEGCEDYIISESRAESYWNEI